MLHLRSLALILLLATAGQARVDQEHQQSTGKNPIRRVVNMLQMMAKKVAEEGKREEELYEKFMCYCESSGGALGKSISDAETKIPQVESDLKEAIATKAQLEQELVDHRKDRAAAKDSIATATAIREKEHKEYSKEAAEVSANVNALSQAIPAIEKGMAGSFLQTPTAGALRKLLATA